MLGAGRILRRESADQMLTLQAGGPYGLGFRLDGEGGTLRFGHSGDNEGFSATLWRTPTGVWGPWS